MISMPFPYCQRLTFISSVILATALAPINSQADTKAFNPEDCKKQKGVVLNFPNTEIREVITSVSDCIGKNIIIDPRVSGKVTMLSKTPLKKSSIYDVFLDVLRAHNYVAIEQGDVIKIVPLEEAKQNPVSTSAASPGGSEQITQILKIKNVSAAQLVPVLRPLMPREAYLQAYMDTNTLVISDSEKNIHRLIGVIEKLDKPNQDRDEIVPLYQANADEVLRILRETQPKKTETSGTVTADKRSNSIIISGSKAERERFSRIIKSLDTPIANHAAHHVVALKYAKATELAPILDKVINRTGGGSIGGSSTPPSLSGAPGSGIPTGGGANSTSSNIVADESTNSLIISADLQSYQSIQDILRQLDIPRKQVMIEAIIAEVSTNRSKNFGIQWGFQNANVGVASAAGSPSGIIGSASAKDMASAFFTGGLSAIVGSGDIVAMLRALKSDTDVNILSAPQILTLDNKEAEMVVGENEPFPTGSYTQPTGGAATNPFTTVQRQDVGLILKVKPQINQGGMITLEVSQETSAVKSRSATLGPTTTKRSMKSNVSVADGNMLVLGGLMDNQTDDGSDSIPIAGDIPLFGWLFKTKKTEIKKTTLMVFIRPTIIDSEKRNNPAMQKALSTMEKEQQLFNERDLLLTPDSKRYQITPQVAPLPELEPAPQAATE